MGRKPVIHKIPESGRVSVTLSTPRQIKDLRKLCIELEMSEEELLEKVLEWVLEQARNTPVEAIEARGLDGLLGMDHKDLSES